MIDNIMKKIMLKIYKGQKLVDKMNRFYTEYSRYNCIITIVILIVGIILSTKLRKMSLFLILLSIFNILLTSVNGWHESAKKLLKLLLWYNLLIIGGVFSVIIFMISENKAIDSNYLKVIFIPYFIIWIIQSMLAKPEVARIVNEVLSACLTIVFTAGTYISSIIFSKYPSLIEIGSIHDIEKSLNSHTESLIRDKYILALLNELFVELFMFILPFLCVSIFCLVAISVKQYWLKVTKQKEYWDESPVEEDIINESSDIYALCQQLLEDNKVLKKEQILLRNMIMDIKDIEEN